MRPISTMQRDVRLFEHGGRVKIASEYIWELIRGDLPIADFERLAYNDTTLEDYLGHELYLEVVSNDFRSGDEDRRQRRLACEFRQVRVVAQVGQGVREVSLFH